MPWIVVLFCAMLLLACGDGSDPSTLEGGGGESISDGGTGIVEGDVLPEETEDPGDSGPTVSFAAEIQLPIFSEICTKCHFTGNLSGLPDFSDGASYQNLVNQDATLTDGGGKRVIPGDAANSILYQRISAIGLPATEARMPLGGPFLSESAENKIKIWINEGALNN